MEGGFVSASVAIPPHQNIPAKALLRRPGFKYCAAEHLHRGTTLDHSSQRSFRYHDTCLSSKTGSDSDISCSALLWLRIGELRMRDNPALAAASMHRGSLLPVLTLQSPNQDSIEAAKDLRRALRNLGSTLVVFCVNFPEQEVWAVNQAVTDIGAQCVYANCNPKRLNMNQASIWTSLPRMVLCTGLDEVICASPSKMPRLPTMTSLRASDIAGISYGGETTAYSRLTTLLAENNGISVSIADFTLTKELHIGCISKQRIRKMVNDAKRRRVIGTSPCPALWGCRDGGILALSLAAYDVHGLDRRGIQWDEKSKKFRLKEWEHAETERRMNAKQRGSEFVRRKKMFLTRAFFPDDVTPDYYSFTAWRFAQRCVSATVGVFGTQALLLALGVKAGRIGQAAAISWVLKDGLGRVGKMLWASGMGKDFDVDPKRWRFRSALLYAFGNGMEIVTQIFPASFLVVATIANSMKQVSMLTSSATRNAMYRSFGGGAQNIANITAKGEAQIVVADLIGMTCGIQLSKAIGTSRTNVLAAYTILTIADIFGIYMELRQIVFRTLNAERSNLVIENYIRAGKILSPLDVSGMERIFLRPRYKSRSRFSSIAKAAMNPNELDMLLHIFRKEKFLVSLPRKRRAGPCRVVLRKDATNEDVLRALLTVGYVLDRVRNGKRVTWLNGGNGGPDTILRSAHRAAKKTAPTLMNELQRAGWNTDNLLFGTVKRGAWWGAPIKSG